MALYEVAMSDEKDKQLCCKISSDNVTVRDSGMFMPLYTCAPLGAKSYFPMFSRSRLGPRGSKKNGKSVSNLCGKFQGLVLLLMVLCNDT